MCWSNNLNYLWFLVLFNLSGCISPEETTDFETDLISLEKVVDSIFSTGNEDSIRHVSKTIWVNKGQPETKNLDDYNIKEDLDELKDYDVATPRWADFIDTNVKDSAGYHLITYTSENDRAPIRYITFVKKGNEIKSVKVMSQKETLISSQEMKINWKPGQGYDLENTSHLLLRNPSIFQMRVRY